MAWKTAVLLTEYSRSP